MRRHAMLLGLAFTVALASGVGEPAAAARRDEAEPMVR